MPIIFVSLSESFTEKMKSYGFDAYTMRIEDYQPKRKTYYVSPANSLCFMDGGIDYALNYIIFKGIEKEVKQKVHKLGRANKIGQRYLPIGSSVIVDRGQHSLVAAPTMLLPQNVQNTQNAYYATMAILANVLINRNENIDSVDIIFTSLCCGYGKMSEDESIRQTLKGIRDFRSYVPTRVDDDVVHLEPNLLEQPKLYQNTAFFDIDPKDIVHC
jgi:O-acetyl-ADP-ribose deacetylase (regulator of RNase III)